MSIPHRRPQTIAFGYAHAACCWLIAAAVGLASLAGCACDTSEKLEQARVESTKAQLEAVSQAVAMHQVSKGKLPRDLEALTTANPPFLRKDELMDPWDRPLLYNMGHKPGCDSAYELRSSGPDGKPNTVDDVVKAEEGSCK